MGVLSVWRRVMAVVVVVAVGGLVGGGGVAMAGDVVVVDGFEDVSGWEVVVSEGVRMEARAEEAGVEGGRGGAVRLDYEFETGGGFAILRRVVDLELPGNYEFAFWVRGEGPEQTLEFKLLDSTEEASKANVWWVNRMGFAFPRSWERLVQKRRHVTFAWGPAGPGVPMTRVRAIEFAIASYSGGKGTVWLDELTLRALPEPRAYAGVPVARATSEVEGHEAGLALEGAEGSWRAAGGEGAWTVDFGESREFGGVVIGWGDGVARRVGVSVSEDGSSWVGVGRVEREAGVVLGGEDWVRTAEAQGRYLRLEMEGGEGGLEVAEVRVLPVEVGDSLNAWVTARAKALAERGGRGGGSGRGVYPRMMLGEQTFWTVVGQDRDVKEALVNEDGAVEVDKKAWSLETVLTLEDGVFEQGGRNVWTWAQGESVHDLSKGTLPIPTVRRANRPLRLDVTAVAAGPAGSSELLVRHVVTNVSQEARRGRMWVLARPFMVNPPWQDLKTRGGVSRIGEVRFEGDGFVVDGVRRVAFSRVPEVMIGARWDDGEVVGALGDEGAWGVLRRGAGDRVEDEDGMVTAGAGFDFALEPGGVMTVWSVVPMHGRPGARSLGMPASHVGAEMEAGVPRAGEAAVWAQKRLEFEERGWERLLGGVTIAVPERAPEAARRWGRTYRATLGYVLVNRDGAAIQPGSRVYERSWARDGSMTSAALLEAGLREPVREWIEWFGGHQFASGAVPCVVDGRGPDPVPEHDSHGQYIWALWHYFEYTRDRGMLERHWPRVERAVAYIQELRQPRMGPEYADPKTTKVKQEPGKPAVSAHAFYGLVTESISHEGYSAKPMHSYWDCFFVLRGLKDAAAIAKELGKEDRAAEYGALADEFRERLRSSIALAAEAHGIGYVPGCVELGDFDATSTTVALFPCDEPGISPLLGATFEKAWENFVRRRDGGEWLNYTPYELRMVGAFTRLGWRERVGPLLEWYFSHQRPMGWMVWGEIVWREERVGRFIGDMPHTWCGSDFLNAARAMVVYEREADESVVVMGGVPAEWLTDEPLVVRGLRTLHGTANVRATRNGDDFEVVIERGLRVPAGGVWVPGFLPREPREVLVNGRAVRMEGGMVRVEEVPAEVQYKY